MAEDKSFLPTAFQSCTVKKAIDELFEPNRTGPRRFLIADEVGLGKTIVAKHVINHLREQSGRKIVIYVSSSLDITKQNRDKLAANPNEIVHADRINLLYEQKPLNRNLQIISMTPGTSLNLGDGLGNAQERKYISEFIRQNYSVSRSALADIFHGYSDRDNFFEKLKSYKIYNDELQLKNRICSRLESITLKTGITFAEAILSRNLGDEEKKELIKTIRMCMAHVILEQLRPSLIIFDEFQKFSEITQTDKSGNIIHPLGGILLNNNTPTLLLSATPYRLYAENDIFSSDETGSHYSDLKKIFTFLSGSIHKANAIVDSIHNYGSDIQNISEGNVSRILEQKDVIQKNVMRYMSRAERINFEGQNESNIDTLFMSKKYDGGMLTKENILEFMRLSKYTSSRKGLLTFWKSGVYSMSYLDKYKLIENAVDESKKQSQSLASNKTLYTPLKKDQRQHLKVKYLFDDLLSNGQAYSYLWIPPTKPYYPGSGIFSDKNIADNDPKKGLIFSSWIFVPRMVASELGGMRKEFFNRVRSDKVINISGDSWARLFFPSTLLANSLTHKDFAESNDYGELVNRAKEIITKTLVNNGFEIVKNGKSLSAHEVISYSEFNNDKIKSNEYKALLRGNRKWNISNKKDISDHLSGNKLRIFNFNQQLKVASETLQTLAETAVSSPSVCFLRSINNLRSKDINRESWLALSSFCFHDVRSFVNRAGHIDAIIKVGRGNKPLAKAVDYFRIGNFQSVSDEYLYQAFSDKSDQGVRKLLVKLAHIFGPTKANCKVNVSRFKKEQIQNDIVCCFGEGVEDSNSRDTNREAFNSPFWPFVLATTSVGQEGLDFHLYCRDIYHWNLPTNPVDLEQREGRINRFNNYMIRKNIVAAGTIDPNIINRGDSIWSLYLADAKKHARRSDRYNLGISPNWVYSAKGTNGFKFRRHVMDIPCSNDHDAYKLLMEDLDLYRLALGQPNQREFMEKVRGNPYYKSIDHRGITLNFFPHQSRDRASEVKKYFENPDELDLLIKDSIDYLKEIKSVKHFVDLEKQVKRNIANIEAYRNGQRTPIEHYRRSVSALYYFLDPFDDRSDRDPVGGFDDDFEKLATA